MQPHLFICDLKTAFCCSLNLLEYRAMLYSRLENRRMKNKEAKENTKERPRKQLQPLRELKVRVRPMLVDSSFFKTRRYSL